MQMVIAPLQVLMFSNSDSFLEWIFMLGKRLGNQALFLFVAETFDSFTGSGGLIHHGGEHCYSLFSEG